MPAGPPHADVAVPARVQSIARGRRVVPVWRNELGGTTFEIGDAEARYFVKWSPVGSAGDLEAERVRLAWAVPYTRVPPILDHGRDAEGAWLVTRGLPGQNAVSVRWTGAPAIAVAAIGAGLRALHDALPVAGCPFSWSVEARTAELRRGGSRLRDRASWHACHRDLGTDEVLARLAAPPPIDRLVVCHGDACAPNTLIADDGACAGHVDLGSLGIADRWADLAIATWSTTWNYGPGWEDALLAAYGVEPDRERTSYYRLLWDVAP